MVDVFAGCLLERLPHPRAAASLAFFEFAPRPPLPTFSTLARFRKQLPTTVQISLVAPRNTWITPRGAMRPGPEVDAGIEWITRVSDILGAFAIVLATGSELTTGERDRELFAAFLERLRPTGRTLVAAPRGLWEPEDAAPFVDKTHSVFGFDPLEHDALPGEIVYGRVRPMGARPRLTEGHLAQIAERVLSVECERAYVSIESERAYRDMKRFNTLLTGIVAEAGDEDEDEDEDQDDEAEDESEDGDESDADQDAEPDEDSDD